MSIEPSDSRDRLLAAALEFCRQHEIIRDLKRALRPCQEYHSGDLESNDPGTPKCRDAEIPVGEYCDPCKQREANKPAYKAAIKRRSAAKQRMLRWARNTEVIAKGDAK